MEELRHPDTQELAELLAAVAEELLMEDPELAERVMENHRQLMEEGR